MFTRNWPPLALHAETEAPSGTAVAEAREALAYWRGRLRRLPWYRRAARAEARAMVARWQRRIVQAECERWRVAWLAGPALALLDRWTSSRAFARRVRTLRRALVAIAAAVVVAAVAVATLAVIAIAQLV